MTSRLTLMEFCNQNPERAYLLDEWDYKKNFPLTPRDVFWKSSAKRWWTSRQCGHSWESAVVNRSARGSLCSEQSCKTARISRSRHETELRTKKSLAEVFPAIAVGFHPYKNGEVTADLVPSGTNKQYWWLCPTCKHEWRSKPDTRTGSLACKPCGVVKAAEKNRAKAVVRNGSLATTHPELAKEWHPILNGELTPEKTHANADYKVWWLSLDCSHEWAASPYNRARGAGCSNQDCVNQVIGKAARERAVARTGSLRLTNADLANEWHPFLNGTLTPDDVTANSHVKVFWLGDCGHAWPTALNNRVRQESGCTVCSVSKSEKDFQEFLDKTFPELEFIKDRLLLEGREIDALETTLGLGFEFNGDYWHSDLRVRPSGDSAEAYHRKKQALAKTKGVSLFFVWESDWKSQRAKVEAAVKRVVLDGTPSSILEKLTSSDPRYCFTPTTTHRKT